MDIGIEKRGNTAETEACLARLAALIEKYAPHDDIFYLPHGGMYVIRISQEQKSLNYNLVHPGICFVAQGEKQVSLINQDFIYNNSNIVIFAAEVPVKVRVTKASKKEPYLCVVIPINPENLADLIVKIFPKGLVKKTQITPLYVSDTNISILNSVVRLMEIFLNQEEEDLLVPLMIEEVLIKLLRSEIGPLIAQIGIHNSNIHKLSKAICWLKDNFDKSIKIESLAEIAGMSISPFYTQFKKLTLMTPVQYQKTLRLEEAKKLLLSNRYDVSGVSLHVGYSSTSQFSREYKKYFGYPPSQELLKY